MSAEGDEAFISDIDLAFGNDRGSGKKKHKAEHPPARRVPLAPPNPSDIKRAVHGGNDDLDDLRKLRDLLEERMRTQAVAIKSTPATG